MWNFEVWLGDVNVRCIGIGNCITFLPSALSWEVFLTAQLKDLCALIHVWGTCISLGSLSFWAVCRFINLGLLFVFERTVVCYLKQQIYGRLKMSINKSQVPLIFFTIFRFSKWILQKFMTFYNPVYASRVTSTS